MSKKGNDDEIIELTEDELSEILGDDDFDSEGGFDEIPTFQFSNSDPYAKVTPRSEDAPKRDFPLMKTEISWLRIRRRFGFPM